MMMLNDDDINMTPETFSAILNSALGSAQSASLSSTLKSLGRYDFPTPNDVDSDGLGLVAMGGDLAPQTLLSAYAQGLFPWFNEDEPIAWWSPEPRCVIDPIHYQPSKSLRKQARNSRWQLTVNKAFDEVIHACSLPRSDGLNDNQIEGEHTWIHQEMIEAYSQLHAHGFAHSVEVWDEHHQLIGGLYGLKIGAIYFGESMFHTASNASKIAFWGLMRLCAETKVALVDCQLPNDHLLSLGASTLSRDNFLVELETLINKDSLKWQTAADKSLPVARLEVSTTDHSIWPL